MKNIPTFEEHLKEDKAQSLNEGKTPSEEQLKLVQAALPALEKLIEKRTHIKTKLTATLGNSNIKISGDSLMKQSGNVLKSFIKNINVSFWGGTLGDDDMIWFNPKLSYEHPGGGTNGSDFIWSALWFNTEKNEWVEGRLIK